MKDKTLILGKGFIGSRLQEELKCQITDAKVCSYNDAGRLVSWDVGDVAIGQNKSVSFQVGFMPSISQVALVPVIVSSQEFSGVDRFVRYKVEGSTPPLTTASASVSSNGGTVVP